jgi:hypothetical protein
MKECLHCKKEFQEQKQTAKYCSTSCRVMYNRNKPKKTKVFTTESKLEVMCNAVMDMLTTIKFQQATSDSYIWKPTNIHDELPIFPTKPKLRRTFENYQQLKLDCESIEVWENLKAEINASDLSSKQKALLTS